MTDAAGVALNDDVRLSDYRCEDCLTFGFQVLYCPAWRKSLCVDCRTRWNNQEFYGALGADMENPA